MIKSVTLNIVVLGLGLLFLVAGCGYLLEDVSWAGVGGLLHPRALVFGTMNLALSAWCIRGSIQNLRARARGVNERPSIAQRVAGVLALVMLASLAVIAHGNWRASERAGFEVGYVHWIAVTVFIGSLLATPIVAIWGGSTTGPKSSA